MSHERLRARVQTLLDAHAKITEKLDDSPDNSKAGGWGIKLAEYTQSLANFEKYGQETPPTGNKVSVSIDIPTGKFTIEALEPGV